MADMGYYQDLFSWWIFKKENNVSLFKLGVFLLGVNLLIGFVYATIVFCLFPDSRNVRLDSFSVRPSFLIFVILAVILFVFAAIEEFVFRVIPYWIFRSVSSFSDIKTVIWYLVISSLIFAVPHFFFLSCYAGLPQFFGGIILGIIFLKSADIWNNPWKGFFVSSCVHCVFNFVWFSVVIIINQ